MRSVARMSLDTYQGIPQSAFRNPQLSRQEDRMLVLLAATVLAIQQPVADTSPFRALPLPAASRVRSASGAPGPDYWQQEASYTIQATLDTATQTLRGSERIHYV